MRKILTLLTALLFGFLAVQAQTRTVTGKIVDSAGAPIEGASVLIKGTSRGVASSGGGMFSLVVKNGDVITVIKNSEDRAHEKSIK